MAATIHTTERKPIAGALSGLALGLGLALLLVGREMIAFGTLPVIILPVVFLLLGILWGLFGPARSRRGRSTSAGVPSDTAG
jgi:membrane associated rhomboid family serine protease